MNLITQIIAQYFARLEKQQTPLERLANNPGNNATRQQHNHKRDKGYTKASHEESKIRRLMAKRSRRINRR